MRAFREPLSRVLSLLCLAAIPLLAGCAGSALGNMWRDPNFKTEGMRKVLVLAVRTDPVRRRLWEDAFFNGLGAYGTKVTRSYELWSVNVPDSQQVRDVVRRDGYDGVLINRRPPDTAVQNWVSGYTKRESVTQQDPLTGAFYTYWRDVEVPPRADTTTIANFRTDVWTTTEGGRLVWSGMSHMSDQVNPATIQYQVEKLILPQLSKSGVLPKKGSKPE